MCVCVCVCVRVCVCMCGVGSVWLVEVRGSISRGGVVGVEVGAGGCGVDIFV